MLLPDRQGLFSPRVALGETDFADTCPVRVSWLASRAVLLCDPTVPLVASLPRTQAREWSTAKVPARRVLPTQLPIAIASKHHFFEFLRRIFQH